LSRVVNLLFALALIVALVVALDPNARKKAADIVQDLEPTLKKWDDTIIVNAPSIKPADQASTPVPTPTPFPTPVVEDDGFIPNTGSEDSSDEPIIVINWDALGDSLRKLWESLKVKIDMTPQDNR
jgi:hypothetical protein